MAPVPRSPPKKKKRKDKPGRKRTNHTTGYLALIKESKPCTDCGKWFPFYVMQFDHVRGEKRAGVACMHRHRLELVIQEIEKCDLVCANCHAIRTYMRKYDARI